MTKWHQIDAREHLLSDMDKQLNYTEWDPKFAMAFYTTPKKIKDIFAPW